MKTFIRLWEFFFDPWETEVLTRGTENWISKSYLGDDFHYIKHYIEYKYTHKFFKKEKIVKEYLK